MPFYTLRCKGVVYFLLIQSGQTGSQFTVGAYKVSPVVTIDPFRLTPSGNDR